MPTLTRDELKHLINHKSYPSVSIYMPTYHTVPDVHQNAVRFKNLLESVRKQLRAKGMKVDDIEQFFTMVRPLLDDTNFWEHQQEGLAFFFADRFLRHYYSPVRFEEQSYSGPLFYVKPLLKLFASDGTFFLLAISQNELRFYECSQSEIKQVHLPSLPKNLPNALKYEEKEGQESKHFIVAQHKAGGGLAMSHGQTVSIPGDGKNLILRYFQEVDRGLKARLRNEAAPLIFAGVDYLFPIYQQANSYANLLDETIGGSPQPLNEKALHERAWRIAQKHFRKTEEQARALYTSLRADKRTSSNIADVLRESEYGRVEYLFVAEQGHEWGRFDERTKEVELHPEPTNGDMDLLDLVARQTFMNNGMVFPLDPASLLDGQSVAAVYRY